MEFLTHKFHLKGLAKRKHISILHVLEGREQILNKSKYL
jgi:hypothetical protein